MSPPPKLIGPPAWPIITTSPDRSTATRYGTSKPAPPKPLAQIVAPVAPESFISATSEPPTDVRIVPPRVTVPPKFTTINTLSLVSTATPLGMSTPLNCFAQIRVPAGEYFTTNPSFAYPLALVSDVPPKFTVPLKEPATSTLFWLSVATAQPMSSCAPP